MVQKRSWEWFRPWTLLVHRKKQSKIECGSNDVDGFISGYKTKQNFWRLDARFNLVDDDDNEDDIQEPERPIGRTNAKRASTTNTSGSNANDKLTRLVDTITELKDKADSNLEYKIKKLDLQLQIQRMK